MDLGRESRAQVSAELIIVIAAVVAIALVLVSNLKATTEEGLGHLNKTSKKVLGKIQEIEDLA